MLDDELAGIDHGARVVAPRVALTQLDFGAYVVGIAANRAGTYVGVTTGDRCAWLLPLDDEDSREAARVSFGSAFVVSQSADVRPDGFLVGLDDGTLRRIAPGAASREIRIGESWVENVTTDPGSGRLACSAGRAVCVLDAAAAVLHRWTDHPSTPTGLSFSPDGGQLAVARYNGVTVWDAATGGQVRDLFWRGSHTAVAWSPDGTYIATATQDRDLHCWRVTDGHDYRMRGYPSKIRGLSWSCDSQYLCSGGADSITVWSCAGAGPAGKPPIELGYVFNGTATKVACHPSERTVAAGYDDGTVLIGDIASGEALVARPAGGGVITALAWTPDGLTLLAGTETGSVATMRLAPRPARAN